MGMGRSREKEFEDIRRRKYESLCNPFIAAGQIVSKKELMQMASTLQPMKI
jgi:hypothetical protein